MFRLRNAHPRLQPVLHGLNRFLRIRPPTRFAGWGMTTTHEPPWTTSPRDARFRESLALAPSLTFTGEAGITADTVDQLAWRHHVVTLAVRLAADAAAAAGHDLVLAECGVADGTTAWFALREATVLSDTCAMHLYDAWDAIPSDAVTTNESFQAGRYAGLELETTRRNLAAFADRCVWHVGYLPGTLCSEPPPQRLAYAHVDLNVAGTTREVVDLLWPRLLPHAVLLFDDYGWLGFEDTKGVVDELAAAHDALLLPFPTAQAILLLGQ